MTRSTICFLHLTLAVLLFTSGCEESMNTVVEPPADPAALEIDTATYEVEMANATKDDENGS